MLTIVAAVAGAAALAFAAGLLSARRASGRRLDGALRRLDNETASIARDLQQAADRAEAIVTRGARDHALAPNVERLLERIAAEGAPAHAFRALADGLRPALADDHRLPAAKQPPARDELTGVRDRAGYEAELEREIARAKRSSQPFALVLLDLGDLAEARVRNGHAEVDRLLQDFAALLVRSTRVTDAVCRRRRGEFGILLPGTDGTGARHLRQRVRAAAAEADFGRFGPVTFSSGIVEWRRDETREDFEARAVYARAASPTVRAGNT